MRARVFQAFDDGRVRALPADERERRRGERTTTTDGRERGGGREPFQGVSECHLLLVRVVFGGLISPFV